MSKMGGTEFRIKLQSLLQYFQETTRAEGWQQMNVGRLNLE